MLAFACASARVRVRVGVGEGVLKFELKINETESVETRKKREIASETSTRNNLDHDTLILSARERSITASARREPTAHYTPRSPTR